MTAATVTGVTTAERDGAGTSGAARSSGTPGPPGERAELRAEYARLDDTRARFYAFPHRPWRVRQFEAWYSHQHAELDARWARVS